MKKYDHRMTRWLLLALALVLYACSDDDSADRKEQRNAVPVELCPYAPWFQEEGSTPSCTRAFPNDYSNYVSYAAMYGTDGMFKYQTDLTDATIDLYFTKAGTDDPGNPAKIYYSILTRRWGSTVSISSGAYYLYGFIPAGVVEDGSSIAPNTEYQNGATLTLTKLSTITPSDVCVVVAAGQGDATGPNPGYAIGKFQYPAMESNYIYLLFDHLYSSMRFSFRVANSYDALRTIKLKKLQMKNTGMKKYVDATITLTANGIGESPISNVSFSSESYVDSGDADGTLFDNSEEPVVLSTSASEFIGCFMPVMSGSNEEFILTSTYDVYDKKGNLIREGCEAINTITLSKLSTAPTLGRGKMLTINLTVNPTYLYMLSEPDLDNPTIKIN